MTTEEESLDVSSTTESELQKETTKTLAEDESDMTEEPLTTVNIVSIEEDEEETVITTTTQRPSATDIADDTTALDISTEISITLNEIDSDIPKDSGTHEFDCKEIDHNRVNAGEDQIPLECILRNGDEPKTVYIVINKEGVNTRRLFDKNVKVVVKDLMIMDIS